MSNLRRIVSFPPFPVSVLVAALVAWPLVISSPSAAAPGLGQLRSALGQEQARQGSLAGAVTTLGTLITRLDGQITLVRTREASVAAQLQEDRDQQRRIAGQLTAERARLRVLRRRLALARRILSAQLVSGYESAKPSLISVVLDSHGFTQLLEQLDFLGRAEDQQQGIIALTRSAKAQADRAAARLAALGATARQVTTATQLRVNALAGMNALLASREAALGQARAAQQAALQASDARAADLRRQISHVQAQLAAAAAARAAARAAAAAAAARAAANAAPSAPTGPAPSGGWSIPYAIVLCESGGQNLPPNSAGASGYYQIVPGTWRLFGGSGPAAYLASKSEQDAVATRIWNGGAGASNWVCAGLVGDH